MITLTTEQAQQIEEALEDIVRVFEFETGTPVEALATIRSARAQEQVEQDPVGECEVYIGENGEANFDSFRFTLPKHFPSGSYKLYAAPVRTKDLTDDEVAEITKDFGDSEYRINRISCARAVIAADREKNK